MAGLRQGLAPLHPARGPQKVILFGVGKGRNAVEDGADRGFLVPRGMGAAQGKKLWAAPLKRGARGEADRCQAKPLTRTWVSAVADSLP